MYRKLNIYLEFLVCPPNLATVSVYLAPFQRQLLQQATDIRTVHLVGVSVYRVPPNCAYIN